jgi:hypothetical protein
MLLFCVRLAPPCSVPPSFPSLTNQVLWAEKKKKRKTKNQKTKTKKSSILFLLNLLIDGAFVRAWCGAVVPVFLPRSFSSSPVVCN